MLALAWGVLAVILGLTQTQILPGQLHWLVQFVHLLVGLGILGQAESLTGRIILKLTPALQL